MKFRKGDADLPEPEDGLEGRLTSDAEAWLQETAPTLTDSPAALLPGGPSAAAAQQSSEDAPDELGNEVRDEPMVTAPIRGAWARRAPLLVAAAVIALVAAVAIPLVANRSHTAAPTPPPASAIDTPQCPSTDSRTLIDEGSVEPAAGSLVPVDAPLSMLICEYPLPIEPVTTEAPSMGATIDFDYQDLRKSRTITNGLSSAPNDLSRYALSPDAVCSYFSASGPGMSRPSGSNYLVALRYPTGIVWISDSTGPNTCTVASGSAATSTGSYADLFTRSLASGVWEPSDRRSVECPQQVDATPFDGASALSKPSVDTEGLLVPTGLPSAVVLCGYGQVQPENQPQAKDVPEFDLPLAFIQQRFELQGNFTPLVSELRSAPPADPSRMRCPRPTDTPTPQLLGLTYDEGAARQTIWIDARIGGTCGLVTNGASWASGGIQESIRVAMAGRSWAGMKVLDLTPDAAGPMPSAPQTFPGTDLTTSAGVESAGEWSEEPSVQESLSAADEECVNPGSNTAGLSKTMIPAGYSSVVICFGNPVVLPDNLVDKINALSDPVDASKCFNGDTFQDMDETPSLVFLYTDRSPVWLYFYDYCAPLIGNGDHEVAAPKVILDQLLKMAGY